MALRAWLVARRARLPRRPALPRTHRCRSASSAAGVPIGREPTSEDRSFARRVAATPPDALSAADASRAALCASQILRLPPPEDGPQDVGSDPWAVPLGQLLRTVVAYPTWLVPIGGQGSGEVEGAMQTMTLEHEEAPLLVACADGDAVGAAPSPIANPTERSYVEFSGAELVFQWQQSHSSAVTFKEGLPTDAPDSGEAAAAGLGGVIFNPSLVEDGKTGGSGVLNNLCLPHLTSIAAAQPAESALAELAAWLNAADESGDLADEEAGAEEAPVEALQLLARYPFTVLLHIAAGGEQRLQSLSNGNTPLLTAVDFAVSAAAVLKNTDDGEWRAVNVPLSAIIQASAAQGGGGVDLVYGWTPEDDASAEGVLSVTLPSAAAAVDLWEAAGVELLEANAGFWEPSEDGEKGGKG